MMRCGSTGGLFSVPLLRVSDVSPVFWLKGVCIDHQRSIQGTSRPSIVQRSMAAWCSGKPVAAAHSSIWWP